MEALWMGYPWLKTACQSSMLSKNSSLVNFTILHSNYLVAERHKVNGVSIVFTAGLVLHICAWTLLYTCAMFHAYITYIDYVSRYTDIVHSSCIV